MKTEKKHNYIYHTTCVLPGEHFLKYYIGKCSCQKSPEDDTKYLGSGTKLKKLLQLIPPECFFKEIVIDFETADEAYSYEKKIVTREMLTDPDCLNVALGGRRAWMGTSRHTAESKKKMSDAQKKRWADPAEREKNSVAGKGISKILLRMKRPRPLEKSITKILLHMKSPGPHKKSVGKIPVRVKSPVPYNLSAGKNGVQKNQPMEIK